jgi:putative ABC transport system permease protein
MRLADQIRGVRHTFASNRGRVALTLLGIMIGAGSIVLLASLLSAGQEALMVADEDASDAKLVRVNRDEPGAKERHKTRRELDDSDAALIDSSPLISDAATTTERRRVTRAFYGKEKKDVKLVAAAPIALGLYRLELARGRFITDEDLHDTARVCVVGINVWRELLGAVESLDGVHLVIDNEEWSVVGVLKNKPSFGGGSGVFAWNSKVVVPRTTYDATYYDQHQVDQIFVRAGGNGALESRLGAARRAIESTLLRHHYGVHNFKVDGWAKFTEQRDMIMGIVKVLLLGTGLLSLLVGGINIMNIMLVTVTERTREIGIRRAVGANPRSVLAQFLLESTLIALVGGVIGVAGGVALAWLSSLLLAQALGHWTLHVEAWSVALGLSLSMATGIVFGLFPAWRAARLDPVEALRYE